MSLSKAGEVVQGKVLDLISWEGEVSTNLLTAMNSDRERLIKGVFCVPAPDRALKEE